MLKLEYKVVIQKQNEEIINNAAEIIVSKIGKEILNNSDEKFVAKNRQVFMQTILIRF